MRSRNGRRRSYLQASFAHAVGERLHLAVVLVATTVEHGGLDARRLGALRQQLAGLARLLHGLHAAQVALGPRHRGQRAAGDVVDELGVDAAVGAEHRDARALGGAGDLRAHAMAALEPGLGPREDGHARLPTFQATYSPS